MSTNRFPKITEEGLADLRERIGVKITNTVEPWNYEASRDAIRHYAHGIGDDNPLWCDQDHSPAKGNLAPDCTAISQKKKKEEKRLPQGRITFPISYKIFIKT